LTSQVEHFADTARDPAVRGFLHRPQNAGTDGLVLTHGAGSNAQAPLLVAVAEALCGAGFTVLRCNLPYRQDRLQGPPRPGDAARDRQGLRNAVEAMRTLVTGRIFMGGHSYGGRQSSMLAAEDPGLASGLLLLSYPLHPPRKPEQLRTQHLPQLQTPALFVQGTRDPFGSIDELKNALKLIPARTELLTVEGAGHDLDFKKRKAGGEALPLDLRILQAFQAFLGGR
jgi:predicted alpha/beta-hydrolase family hydrolase